MNIRFPLEQEKIRPRRHLAQLSIWTIGLGILDIRDTVKLSKDKMDSKAIKSHQYSLDKSYNVSFELNSEL